MTPEEKQQKITALKQRGDEAVARANSLVEKLALGTARLKRDVRRLKDELTEELARQGDSQ